MPLADTDDYLHRGAGLVTLEHPDEVPLADTDDYLHRGGPVVRRLPGVPRRAATTAGLVLVWCGLWGSVSIANLASGLALAVVVLATDRAPTTRQVIRFRPLLKFAWLVLGDLARSTINVAIEIATPNDGTEEVIVAVDLPATGSEHMLLLSASITLSPGTAVVDVDRSVGRYYIHLLHGRLRSETVAHAHELARLACEALPTSNPMGVR